MGERTLDAIAGIIFVLMILGMEYINFDFSYAKPFFWVFAILFHSYIFGKNCFPQRRWPLTIPLGFLLLMAVQSFAQTLWFYIGAPLGGLADAWSLAIAMAAAHFSGVTSEDVILLNAPPVPPPPEWDRRKVIITIILAAASIMSLAYIGISAWQAGTMESIRTPWPLLPKGILPAIAILWIAAALSALYVENIIFSTFHAILALLGTLIIAPLIYSIGFGFDGFLHVAGQKVLALTGELNPKPMYYMGQYVFVTWLYRALQIPLAELNRWLVPVATSLLLPISLSFAYDRLAPNAFAVLMLAMLPLGMFVGSTPQGFAMLIGLMALILALGASEKHIRMSAPIWLGLWAITIHPLAGIPLMTITVAILLYRSSSVVISKFSWPLAVLSGLTIPLVFFLGSKFTASLNIEWNLAYITQWSTWAGTLLGLVPWIGNHFVLWPAWSSLINATIPALALALIVLIFLLPAKIKTRTALLLISAASLILASGLLENASDFTFLIHYERGDYAARLLQLAIFVLLIAAVPAVIQIFAKLKSTVPVAGLLVIIFLGAVGAANAHNALPRHDAVQASRGWSTGKYDIEAVRWIDRYAKGAKYTVLANQSVSAASVLEFGFKRYTQKNIFYYPIPTGGELYNVYLKMTYEDPSLDTVRDAARLGESDLVFVVINDYWWRAEELNEKISALADDEWDIGEGKVKIYVFNTAK
ncbi:MAG: hypothetical protein ACOYUZ_06265 [Patescibacteria group bacterium]